MAVVLIATFEPKSGHRDEVVAAIEKSIARVHAEDAGCELYALHEEGDNLIMIEKWESFDALGAHSKSPALTELLTALDGLTVGKGDVKLLTPHPSGDAAKGAL